MVRQTHRVFFLVGQVPLYACAVASALWKSCPATRSPSCERLHRQTWSAAATTDLCQLFVHVSFWLDGPWRRHNFKRRQLHEDAIAARTKRPNKKSVLDTATWDDTGSHFYCVHGCPKAGKKSKNSESKSIFLWSRNPVGYKLRSSRPSAGKFPGSPHAHDDVQPRPPWRTPSRK